MGVPVRTASGGGVVLIVLATASFATLDTSTKWAGALAPVMMLLWFRYVFQAGATLLLRLPVQGWQVLATRNPRFQFLRGMLLLVTSVCSFLGLQHLPVGEFTAMVMLGPLVVTALAAWLLKEKVPLWRWLLLVGGLAGALLVIRPGGQVFGWALLFPVVMVTAFAGFQVITSRMSGDENAYTTHFYTGLVGTVLMAPLGLAHWDNAAWVAQWPWFVLIGAAGTFGHWLLILAYRTAPASTLTPYLYTQIAFATLAGWLAFRHAPDALAWLGIAIIVCCGVAGALLSAHEASRVARQTAAATMLASER